MKPLSETEINWLKKADQDHYFHPTSNLIKLQEKGPKIIAAGKGCKVYDVEGKEYIDGTGGLWLNAIGHGRPEIAEVAKNQIEQLEYYQSFNEFSNIPAIKLAEKVAKMVPVDKAKIFFTSGGSESNDTIFKMVRYYWDAKGQGSKDYIISRGKAYHGVSYGAVSATRLPFYHGGFQPLLPAFDYIDPPYCYLCPWEKEYPGCSLECAHALEEKIKELGQENVAAFVAEPVAGTGGVLVPPPGYYEIIRKICDQYEVLFVSDEVICGFGRTGSRFGIEHWNVKPDAMTMAKAISSGYVQLGAVAVSGEIYETIKNKGPFFHGYTYCGHPVACAVGLKNLEIIEAENLIENAKVMGQRLLAGLKELNLAAIGEVRGKGLMVGVDLFKDRTSKEKFPTPLGLRVVEIAYENGLICRSLLGDIVQLSPPMVITAEEVDFIVNTLAKAIDQAYQEFLA
ncbi:MAG: aspartate aminotransferase family protein [Bacillota bacterium]